MRRPLLLICLLLMAVTVLRGRLPGGTDAPEDIRLPENGQVTITGQIVQKDSKYFYLSSIHIFIQQAAGSQQIFTENTTTAYQKEIAISPGSRLQWETGKEEQGNSLPPIGTLVTMEGTLRLFLAATNPGEFDSREYYESIGIVGRLKKTTILESREPEWKEGRVWYGIKEMLYQLKQYFLVRLYRIFPEKEASAMSTMLLGERSALDAELKELYQKNGIIHILSISGLHITLIGMGVYGLLKRLGAPAWLSAVLGGVLLTGYGFLTGMGISACRAIGMYLIRMLGNVLGRTYDMLTALGVMAVILSWGNPAVLGHAGFLLSFGSLLGIGVVYPVWQEGIEAVGGKGGSFSLRIASSLAAGLSITLTTLPVQLWFYYEVPVYSMVINLVVLPFMGLVVLTGMLAMLVPGLGIIGTVDCIILQGYEVLCHFFEGLPFHTWNPGRPQLWQVLAYYGLLTLSCLWIKEMGSRIRNRCAIRTKPRGNALQRTATPVMLLATGILLLQLRLPQGNRVTFLDVGQGDGICIQTRGEEVYLFDGGSSSRSELGEYVLLPYLKYHGIRNIQAMFLSHPDTDHYNGAVELLRAARKENIDIRQVILPNVAERQGEAWQEILDAVWEYYGDTETSDLIYIQEGQSLQSRDISMTCLHPPAGYANEDSNAGSQCFYIEFPGCEGSLLLTGDVQGEGEELLLGALEKRGIADISVLKVAHHGSKNSTPDVLLERLKPQWAVISCGKENRYGHPHRELLERLEEVGATCFQTSETGALTLLFKKDSEKD